MESYKIIEKIKKYSLISVLLPLITLNACLYVYKFLGTVEADHNFNWGNQQEVIDIDKYILLKSQNIYGHKDSSFLNCSKYKNTGYFINNNDQTIPSLGLITNNEDLKLNYKSFIIKYEENINKSCVKNYKFMYWVIDNFNWVDRILLKAKLINESGFSLIVNPYIYGEVSISRTARHFPNTFIFKPFIVLGALFLFLYWKSNLNFFNNSKKNNEINNFSRKFFYLGVLSCICLSLHAIFLGVDLDSKLFSKLRRLIIILFIFFEISGQILLTANLFKLRDGINKYIHPLVLKLKIIFVTLIIFVTVISFAILGFGDPSNSFKHILEWNYFSVLLIFYLLSRMLWRKKSP